MPIRGICVLALFPRFPESFSVLCWCFPWVCWGEPPSPSPPCSPCSCRGREAQKLPVCAFGRQLMAQPSFGNLCSATGAGRGMDTLLLFPWGLPGIWEFWEWQKGILHKHALKDPLPFPAQRSKMGFPLPATQIGLLKNCGLLLEHKCLRQGCCARLEQGLFVS